MKASKKQIKSELKKNGGLITDTACALGISRQSLYERLKKDADLQRAKKSAEETVNDLAERKLFKAIDAGQPWAVQFYLKTKAKHRGYSEKIEVSSKSEISNNVNIECTIKSIVERIDNFSNSKRIRDKDSIDDVT